MIDILGRGLSAVVRKLIIYKLFKVYARELQSDSAFDDGRSSERAGEGSGRPISRWGIFWRGAGRGGGQVVIGGESAVHAVRALLSRHLQLQTQTQVHSS